MTRVRRHLVAWCSAGLLLLGNSAASQPDTNSSSDWRFTSHRDGEGIDGVDVYVRPVPGSAYDEARAVGSVCASIDALTSLVTDVSRFEEWIPDTERVEQLAAPSAYERIYYIRTGMPWPIKDRDMVYRVVSSANPLTADAVTVTLQGLPDYAPPTDGVVRMRSVQGEWHFAHVAAGTRISLQMRIEPGGGVPAWLARRRIVGMPAKMLLNIGRLFASSCPVH